MKEISIYSEYIKLEQFLKIADIVASGGEAKAFIADNLILINKEEEKRRGRKLYKGDVIEVLNKTYKIC